MQEIIGKLVSNLEKEKPSPISPYLFHLYSRFECLRKEINYYAGCRQVYVLVRHYIRAGGATGNEGQGLRKGVVWI